MKNAQIGQRILELMERKSVSLPELSQRTGLREPVLQTLMEDDRYPALGSLLRISRALGVRLGTFLDDQITEDPHIVRADDRRERIDASRQAGAAERMPLLYYPLGAGKSDRHMEPFYVEVLPETGGSETASSHEGEEFMLVLKGAIEVIYGGRRHTLASGDSIYYNSAVPHYVRCVGEEKAALMAVLYDPQ